MDSRYTHLYEKIWKNLIKNPSLTKRERNVQYSTLKDNCNILAYDLYIGLYKTDAEEGKHEHDEEYYRKERK